MTALSRGVAVPAGRRWGVRLLQAYAAVAIATVAVSGFSMVAAADDSPGPAGSKTVSVVGGKMTNPVEGIIAITGLQHATTYRVVDVLQALPNGAQKKNRFYQGSYTLSWNSCTSGSATGSTYNVGPNLPATSFSVGTTPMTAGPLATITTASDGTFRCHYSLAFTVVSVTGGVVSVRNDVFVFNLSGGGAVHFASASVGPPPLSPPPGIPEAPIMFLLPLSALAVFAVAILIHVRRLAGAAVT